MLYYTQETVDNLINQYIDNGGKACIVSEGVYGLNKVVCTAKGFKCAVISEKFVGAMETGYSIRLYRKIPKKYEDVLY